MELLKFLYYGVTHGYGEDSKIQKISNLILNKIKIKEVKTCSKIKKIFQNLAEHKEIDVKVFQQELVAYYKLNQHRLCPSFWNRLFAATVFLTHLTQNAWYLD
jgi:hypothetical protein